MVHPLKCNSPGESLDSTSSAGVAPFNSGSSRCLASVLQFLSISACHTVKAQGNLPFANAESSFKPGRHTGNHTGNNPQTPSFPSDQSSAFSSPADSSSFQKNSPVGIQDNFWNKALHRHASSAQEDNLLLSQRPVQPL